MEKCKFCGSSEQLEFNAKEQMFGIGEAFVYKECKSCGSLQLATVPSDMSPYYSGGYYSFQELVPSSSLKNLFKTLRLKAFFLSGRKEFEPTYGYWLKKLRPKLSDRIADIGCGNGQLLYELFASGYKDLHGFDPFMSQEKVISPNLTLWKKTIEESEMKFDLIMMHHSFEHMSDPMEILNSCFEKLRSGGKLLIRTPVSDARVWKEEGAFWVQLDAPRHLIIPSIKGFELVSKKVGFELNEVEFDSTDFQFWGTELYKRGLPLNPELVSNEFSKEEFEEYQKKALYYNQEGLGDQVCFYLTKP